MKVLAHNSPSDRAFAGRGTVVSETNSVESSTQEFEKMARRRFQAPKPRVEGNFWYLSVWQDAVKNGRRTRQRKRIKLAPKAMPFREVQKIAAEKLRDQNQGLITAGSATTFGDFIDSVYRPVDMPTFANSTRDRYESVINKHLLPVFKEVCLRDITALAAQRYVSGLAASTLAHESKDKIRDVLASIMNAAVRYQFIVKNPTEGLRLPPSRSGKRIKPFISPAQFGALVEMIAEPYATMIYTAVFTGLRVSELIALKWCDIHDSAITVDERYCRGEWGAPKSEASNATIPVNAEVVDRIHRLKEVRVAVRAGRAVRRLQAVKSSGSDDLVFQSVLTGRPMRDNNILVRHIKPAATAMGIGWVNWQVLRRSHATWLKMAGADVKDAQAQMRHSRATTTLDVYQQFIPESQRAVVNRLHQLAGPRTVN
jgi:integrase